MTDVLFGNFNGQCFFDVIVYVQLNYPSMCVMNCSVRQTVVVLFVSMRLAIMYAMTTICCELLCNTVENSAIFDYLMYTYLCLFNLV